MSKLMDFCRLNLLNHIAPPGYQERVDIFNSPLNEAATVGFEYGYSLRSSGKRLVVWEAQFGDFSNNAQVMIDQFICAGESPFMNSTSVSGAKLHPSPNYILLMSLGVSRPALPGSQPVWYEGFGRDSYERLEARRMAVID